MQPMKLNDCIKLLESHGFILLRSNGHMIFGCGVIRVVLAHSRIVSPGLMRDVQKAIAKTKGTPHGQNLGIKVA
jgi:predicted RNA binding protein YcfA (HicA-like mRNA interferase family)